MSEAHARLGPSNHRWPHCPGSVREEAQYPDIPGDAAIDGTGSHLLLEMCLQNNVSPDTYDMQIIGDNHPERPNGWLVDKERCERVNTCLNYIIRRKRELEEQFQGCTVTVLSEAKSDPGQWFGRSDWWGTCDVTIIVTTGDTWYPRFIETVDYKDGRMWVPEKDNSQLISYMGGHLLPNIVGGEGANKPYYPERVGGCRTTIVQPKTNPVVRYQDYTADQVLDQLLELNQAATKTDDPAAPLVAGSWCKWCKHKQNCTQESEQSVEVLKTMTQDVTPAAGGANLLGITDEMMGDVTQLTSEQLAKFSDVRAGIDAIFNKIDAEIERRVSEGIPVPGWGLAPGKGKNEWGVPEEDVVKALKGRKLKQEDYYPKNLISPAAMEKLENLTPKQKADLKEKLVKYTAGKQVVKRVATQQAPAAEDTNAAEQMFAGVTPQPQNDTPSFM